MSGETDTSTTEQTTDQTTDQQTTDEQKTDQQTTDGQQSAATDDKTALTDDEPSAEEKAAAAKAQETKDQKEGETALTDDSKTGDDKTKAGGKDDDESTMTVEAYADIAMPDGVELQGEYWDSVKAIFAKGKVSKDVVQELVNLQGEQAKLGESASANAFEQLKRDWLTSAKADKEIGGEKFNETLAIAKAGLKSFGSPELTKLLKDYGLGNHPEIIRAFYKVGQLTLEDNPGAGGDTTEKQPLDLAGRLYDDKGFAKQ